MAWYGQEPRPGFNKATVSAWRVALEACGLGAVSNYVRITAVRKLAVEAADNGLLAPELANAITRVKGVASKGVRLGNWLSVKQAEALLNAPNTTTNKGRRDRAVLAVLLGCGPRRSEVAALTFKHIQQRDGRWCIVDLVGKHGRVRTIPMPTWVKVAIDAWTDRRIRQLEQRFDPPENEAARKAVALLQERRRKRLEASGQPFEEGPPARLTDDRGRPLAVSEILQAGRIRARERNHEGSPEQQKLAVVE
jgi:integrase